MESLPLTNIETDNPEKKAVNDFIVELRDRIASKARLREKNFESNTDESAYAKRDSNLKRNSNFVKKLRTYKDSEREQLLREADTLNQLRYVGELADAIVNARPKLTELGGLIEVVSVFHQRYAEFAQALLAAIRAAFSTDEKKAFEPKTLNATRLRTDLRLLCELLIAGVFNSTNKLESDATLLVITVLEQLVRADPSAESGPHITLLLGFLRNSAHLALGLPVLPARMIRLAREANLEVPRDPSPPSLAPKVQQQVDKVLALLVDYGVALVARIRLTRDQIRSTERANRKILETKGDLLPERKEQYESSVTAYKELRANAIKMVDHLSSVPGADSKFGFMPEEIEIDPSASGDLEALAAFLAKERETTEAESLLLDERVLFEDDDTREYYDGYPKLQAILPESYFESPSKLTRPAPSGSVEDAVSEASASASPPAAAGESSAATEVENEKEQLMRQVDAAESPAGGPTPPTEPEPIQLTITLEPPASEDDSKDIGEVSPMADTTETAGEASEMVVPNSGDTEGEGEAGTPAPAASGARARERFEQLVAGLRECVTSDQLDRLATELAQLSGLVLRRSRTLRERVLRALLGMLGLSLGSPFEKVSATGEDDDKDAQQVRDPNIADIFQVRNELISLAARLVTIFNPLVPQLSEELTKHLLGQLHGRIRASSSVPPTAVRSLVFAHQIRLIGELVKFRTCDTRDALGLFRALLLRPFSPIIVHCVSSLLESCGRFLYVAKVSRPRTKAFMEVLQRKREKMRLAERYSVQLDSAMRTATDLSVRPTKELVAKPRVRPPPHIAYINRLLHRELRYGREEWVAKQLRKLDWNNPEIASYLEKQFTNIWLFRFGQIEYVAYVLAELAQFHHEFFAIKVIDSILEDIRLGLEVNNPRDNQRRVACVAYIGEIYSYKLVNTALVLKLLYSFITFGVVMNYNVPSPLDQPPNLFRVRLVCTLLDTVGEYLKTGPARKKLDSFLLYFQRYFWFKRMHPFWSTATPVQGQQQSQQGAAFGAGRQTETSTGPLSFPFEYVALFRETLERLRADFSFANSLTEAAERVAKLEAETLKELEKKGLATPAGENLGAIPEEGAAGEADAEEEGGEEEEEDENNRRATRSAEVEEATGEDDADAPTGGASQHTDEESDEQLAASEEDAGGAGVTDEDREFLAAYNRFVSESVRTVIANRCYWQLYSSEAKSRDARVSASFEVPELPHIKEQQSKESAIIDNLFCILTYTGLKAVEPQSGAVKFRLLTRAAVTSQAPQGVGRIKAGTPSVELPTLDLPADVGFVARLVERKKTEREEKERLKQMTLNIHERQTIQDAVESPPVPGGVNLSGRNAAHHPLLQQPARERTGPHFKRP